MVDSICAVGDGVLAGSDVFRGRPLRRGVAMPGVGCAGSSDCCSGCFRGLPGRLRGGAALGLVAAALSVVGFFFRGRPRRERVAAAEAVAVTADFFFGLRFLGKSRLFVVLWYSVASSFTVGKCSRMNATNSGVRFVFGRR